MYAYKLIEKAVKEGKVKAIGLSNFNETQIQEILDNCEIKPTVLQTEAIDRIKKNLKLDTNDVVQYCKNKVLDKNCNIYKQGKNWYCEIDNIKITINSFCL